MTPPTDLWEPLNGTRSSGDLKLTSIELTVTETCNLRCAHCAVGDLLLVHERTPLPWPLIVQRLEEVPDLSTLSLTGGELSFNPQTLQNSVLPLLRYAKGRGLLTQINTNLTLPLERYCRLLDLVDVFHISFNHLEPESFGRTVFAHRDARIAPQASAQLYGRLLGNIDQLAKKGAFISAETLMSTDTMRLLPQIHKRLWELGAKRHEIHPLYPVDFARHLPLLSLSELEACVRTLLTAQQPGLWLLFGTLPFFWCQASPSQQELLLALRRAPEVSVRNDPDGRNRLNVNLFDGDIHVQDFADLGPIGNIKHDTLEAAYRRWQGSPQAQQISCRCHGVGCLGPNLIVRDSYYRETSFITGQGDAVFDGLTRSAVLKESSTVSANANSHQN